jgi:hypothetical protein
MSNGKDRTPAQWEDSRAAEKKADAGVMAKVRDVANLIDPPGRLRPACRADAFNTIEDIQDHY